MREQFFIQLMLLSSIIGRTLEMGIVNIQMCAYSGISEDGFIYHDEILTYQEAVDYCGSKAATLLSPTQKSWQESLEYMHAKLASSENPKDPNWVGVTFEKKDEYKIVVADTSDIELSVQQRKMLPINEESMSRLKVDEKQCVIYVPPLGGEEYWRFELQACNTDVVTPGARVVCRCISDVQKDVQGSPEDEQLDSVLTNAQQGLNTSLPEGRAGVGGDDIGPKPNSGDPEGSADTSSTPLVIIGCLLVSCCAVATAYFISKKRVGNLRERIAQRMPYNRPRPSVNGDTYLRGQEMSEVSSSNHRPIHVYEEIIPRNSGTTATHRSTVLSSSSSVAIPYLPPPDPPTALCSNDLGVPDGGRLGKSVEDEYLQPSFRRNDAIPGDVRSPPPVEGNVFTFPTNTIPKSNLLNVSDQKELKYASVETVSTLLNDYNQNDEEYFIDDGTIASTEMHGHSDGLVVDIPEEKFTAPECKRNSVFNSYVAINGVTVANVAQDPGTSVFSPVFSCAKEYENERFPKKSSKTPPCKAKRKQHTGIPKLEPHFTSPDQFIVYARIPSVSNEPLYAEVKPKWERIDGGRAEGDCAAYTPMQGDTIRRATRAQICDRFDNSTPAPENNVGGNEIPSDAHNAHESNRTLNDGNSLISPPSMLSTTNEALENSSLVCYEIPPEFDRAGDS